MVTDISSGSFDYAPISHFNTGFSRRSAQDDKLGKWLVKDEGFAVIGHCSVGGTD